MLRIEKTIHVNAPIDQCYKRLLHFEAYPEFLPHVIRVEPRGQSNVWHWQVNCPDATTAEWDLEIHGAKHQHHSISWHTVRDADIAHSGALTLQAFNEDQTELHLVIEYRTYTIGSAESTVKQCIEEGLGMLKAYIEHEASVKVPET